MTSSGRAKLLELFGAKTVPTIPGVSKEEESRTTPCKGVADAVGVAQALPVQLVGGRGRLFSCLPQPTDVGRSGPLPQLSTAPSVTPVVGRGRGIFSALIPGTLVNGSLQKHLESQSNDRSKTQSVSTSALIPNGGTPTATANRPACSNQLAHEMEKLDLRLVKDEPPVVKRGQGGRNITIACNYVPLIMDPGRCVYEYEVRFKPDVDYAGFRMRILSQHVQKTKGIRCYDGGSRLYLPNKITATEKVFQCELPSDGSSVAMTIIYKREMRIKECLFLFNTLINNCTKELAGARLGRQYYDFKNAYMIPQYKLEIWPGYVTAVEEFEGGVYLNCDTSHRVLRTETAHNVISDILQVSRTNLQERVANELLGSVVITRYSNKLYRIDDISWDQNPMSSFSHRDGSMTYVEYYKKQYGLEVMDLNQPLLINKPERTQRGEEGRTICLVPELCFLTGLTDKMRSDFKMMKEIAQHTMVNPSQRDYAFRKYLRCLRENDNCKAMLAGWGLQISPDPVALPARVLETETVRYGRNRELTPMNADWMGKARSFPVIRSVDLRSWLLVYCDKDSNRARGLKSMLVESAPGLGMTIFDPKMVVLSNDRLETYIRTLKTELYDRTHWQMVLLLFPNSRDDRYSAVKKLLTTEIPIPSQVVISNTIAKENKMRAIVQNIALQMNVKLGGALWTVHIPLKNVMICGIDTFHDPGKKQSVGAFVGSLDPSYTTYFSHVCFQHRGQELLQGLTVSFIMALNEWLKNNKCLPDRIIVFRDGVGDGQLPLCRDKEVNQFMESCKKVSPTYHPKLTFIVVQKRINTRYYEQLGNGRVENAPPGTVLDHTVTRRNYYDFFLVSQYVRQGTASPTHYIVLHDDSSMKVEHVQRLCYKFCHMYYNWPGTVRVPAPCQYAHKLAYLVGENVKAQPSDVLNNKLYYL